MKGMSGNQAFCTIRGLVAMSPNPRIIELKSKNRQELEEGICLASGQKITLFSLMMAMIR